MWKKCYDVKSSSGFKPVPVSVPVPVPVSVPLPDSIFFSGLDPDPVLVNLRPEPQLNARGYL